MQTLRIPTRIVFYQEAGEWVAHCLEFDLCGTGTTREEAAKGLVEAIEIQVADSIEYNNPRNLLTPADSEIFERFFAGKDTAVGEIELEDFGPLSNEWVIFNVPQYREYLEGTAGGAGIDHGLTSV